MPDVMPSFARMYPNIQIELKEGRGDYLESLLANDQVDFCIMNTPISYRNVFFEVILKEHIFLVMHKDNRLLTEFDRSTQLGRGYLKHFDITRLRELPQTLIMLKKGQHLTGTVQNLLNKYDLRFDSIFETENLTTAINLVSNGIGITFVPENGIINKPMENVAYFTVDSPPITGELAAVYKNNIPLGWAAKLFVEHIKQYYSSYEM